MAKRPHDDQYREKFRPDADAALDKEIDAALGDLSLEALSGYDKPQSAASAAPAPGKGKGVRRGTIVRVDKDDIFVDFGGKTLGIASQLQFDEEPKAGQEMDFTVERYDEHEGLLILSRKGAKATHVNWENLEVGQIVEGTVTAVNKGGLELEVKAMRAFMPAGQVDIYHVPDLEQFIGQKLMAEVMQCDAQTRNLILSRRNVLEREKEEAKIKLMAELAEGQIRRGTVRSVMDFGAFVDLGGVEGLLHVSELSFKRGRHNATEFVKVGDVLDVKIIRMDAETGKISFSLKQARGTDPWSDAGAKYAVGSSLTGRVTKVENFGAFIEVEEGIEGLLPVSEMSWQRIRHPSDLVKEGDTLKLIVLSIDTATRKISFSLKQAGIDPWSTITERYAPETNVTGHVSRVMDFGAFIELEPGVEGLVHISELSSKQVRSTSDVVKAGQEVRVHILDIDKQARRMSLSMTRVAETELPEPAPGAEPVVAGKKKKRPELRGGLDF